MMILRLLPVLVFSILIVFLARSLSRDPQNLPAVQIGQNIPNFSLPDLLHGNAQRFTKTVFKGHNSLLVVWASWCEACREEQAFLLALAKQNKIALYGLNYKDDPKAAKQWLAVWGNPYQSIGVDSLGKLSLDLGVYGTPETYLINRQGKILQRYAGILNDEIWQREFVPKLEW